MAPPSTVSSPPHAGAAVLAAGLLVAQQVLGKALRDTLFLSRFGIEHLPQAMLASALVSGVLVLTLSRVAAVVPPRRVVSVTLLASVALFALAWLLYPRYPGVSTLLTYFQTGALTPASVSVFWALVTHSFDPYLARRLVPRVLTGATLGGVLGGLSTWRAAWVSSPADLLLLGALLGLGSLAFARRIPATPRVVEQRERPRRSAVGPERSYLRALGALVLASALTQAILDYLLSSAAATALAPGAELLSFFAIFQTGVGVLSFLLQVSVSAPALARFGVGPALLAAPLALVLGSAAPFFVGPLATAIFLRGADGVLGASLQRSGYEVLFVPLDDARRRSLKPLLDVAVDRAGALAGGALVTLVVATAGGSSRLVLLSTVAVLASARALLVPLLQTGYRRLLGEKLERARERTRPSLAPALGALPTLELAPEWQPERQPSRAATQPQRASAPAFAGPPLLSLAAFDLPSGPELGPTSIAPGGDDVALALAELRSGDTVRALAVLGRPRSEPVLVAQVIQLLDDDALARAAADWLSVQQPPPAGALADALLDDRLSPKLRRRGARLLGKIDDERAVASLLDALSRVPTSVQGGVAHALARASARRPIAREPLFEALVRLASTPGLQRDDASLETLFSLLSAAYPEEPVEPAYRALSQPGELRGTALEWLDTLLPHEVKAALWPRIAPGEIAGHATRSPEQLRRFLRARPRRRASDSESGT